MEQRPIGVVKDLFRYPVKSMRGERLSEVEGFEKADIIFHQEDLPPAVTDGWDLRSALRWARSGW